jgi:hypothetical protein
LRFNARCKVKPITIKIKPGIVEKNIFSFKNTEIKIKDKKGERKIRLLILDELFVSFIALSHKAKAKPISKKPTYAAPAKPFRLGIVKPSVRAQITQIRGVANKKFLNNAGICGEESFLAIIQ